MCCLHVHSLYSYTMNILSLFDYSCAMVEPWTGCLRICVDLQTKGPVPGIFKPGKIHRIGGDVKQYLEIACFEDYPIPDVVFGFPPCTDLAVSGARWFQSKAEKNPSFQLEAVDLCREVERIGNYYGVPWMLENPVGRLSTLWRKPDHWFHPWQFADLCHEDNYTKKTGIWCGNGFVMPKGLVEPISKPDDRIHRAPPSAERANFRSKTPSGFAKAVYLANKGQHEKQNRHEN